MAFLNVSLDGLLLEAVELSLYGIASSGQRYGLGWACADTQSATEALG
jgi:hypothetical protein